MADIFAIPHEELSALDEGFACRVLALECARTRVGEELDEGLVSLRPAVSVLFGEVFASLSDLGGVNLTINEVVADDWAHYLMSDKSLAPDVQTFLAGLGFDRLSVLLTTGDDSLNYALKGE